MVTFLKTEQSLSSVRLFVISDLYKVLKMAMHDRADVAYLCLMAQATNVGTFDLYENPV